MYRRRSIKCQKPKTVINVSKNTLKLIVNTVCDLIRRQDSIVPLSLLQILVGPSITSKSCLLNGRRTEPCTVHTYDFICVEGALQPL